MVVAFNLKYSNKEQSLVILHHQTSNGRFRYSTAKSITVKYWDKKEQRLSVSKDLPDNVRIKNKNINSELDEIETFLERTENNCDLHGIKITKEYLYNEFEKKYKLKPLEKSISTPNTDFYSMIDTFIAESKSGNRTTEKGTKITPQRISHYETFKKNLQGLKSVVDVNDIDIKFYKQYIAHRNDESKALNTIGKEINIFKVILRETFKQGLHSNRIFEHDDFKTFSEDVENVYLSDKELDVLWKMKKLSKKHEIVRDVFLIGCYTGLRISDLGILEKYNIIDKGTMLKIIPEKTSEPVFIPIHKRVRFLIKKYGGDFPKAYSDQKMNEYIKKICEIAKFEEMVEYKRTKGGLVEKFTKLKWERVTNHTARRSFATNLYMAGFPTLSIMSVTGHKTESSFMKYICVTQRQMADKMKLHPYFK